MLLVEVIYEFKIRLVLRIRALSFLFDGYIQYLLYIMSQKKNI